MHKKLKSSRAKCALLLRDMKGNKQRCPISHPAITQPTRRAADPSFVVDAYEEVLLDLRPEQQESKSRCNRLERLPANEVTRRGFIISQQFITFKRKCRYFS